MRLWSASDGKPVRKFRGHPAGTCVALLSADGTRMLTSRGAPKPSIELWNTESEQLERAFVWENGRPTSAAVSQESRLVVAGDQKGVVGP